MTEVENLRQRNAWLEGERRHADGQLLFIEQMGVIRDHVPDANGYRSWRFGIIHVDGRLTENLCITGPDNLCDAVDLAMQPRPDVVSPALRSPPEQDAGPRDQNVVITVGGPEGFTVQDNRPVEQSRLFPVVIAKAPGVSFKGLDIHRDDLAGTPCNSSEGHRWGCYNCGRIGRPPALVSRPSERDALVMELGELAHASREAEKRMGLPRTSAEIQAAEDTWLAMRLKQQELSAFDAKADAGEGANG